MAGTQIWAGDDILGGLLGKIRLRRSSLAFVLALLVDNDLRQVGAT